MAGKGQPKTGGRQKGSGNVTTKELKELILGALHSAPGGGQKWLELQRDENPVAFLSILSKTLPRDMTVSGGENPLVTEIKINYVNARDTDTKGI